MSRLSFKLEHTARGSRARAARFTTLHGEVQTPVFMPVGTQATVKAQTIDTLKATGSSVLLANTYHLMLRPGPDVFKKFGGIHRFMQWDGPVLTDSGGFQIFSLSTDRAMHEEGAHFQSYVDGTTHLLSPESSIAMQRAIGSDIMMVLDQCIPSTAPYAQAEAAMELTHRWARRSLAARGDSPQALFGIVQGACHPALREKSAAFLRALPFDGLAIGGLAVGETHAERYEFTGLVTAQLPENLPRYLMGVGTPIDILEAVHRGVDMFDCIIPGQLAQRGVAFTHRGKLQLRRSVHKLDENPIEAGCACAACQRYSRGYLHHLAKSDEMLGWHLIGIHNLHFYHQLMRTMRASILRDEFLPFYETQRHELGRKDDENVVHPVKKRQPTKVPRLGDYDIVTGPQGFSSIRQVSSGEVMHSVNAPSEEAERLYVAQSALAARLLRASAKPGCHSERSVESSAAHAAQHSLDSSAPPQNDNKTSSPTHDTAAATDALVIWDVGLGAASNAMAALQCFEQTLAAHGADALRPLRIVSFECDLDPLKLAVKFASHFPHLRHAAPHGILNEARWRHDSGLLTWELHEGDFLQRFAATPAPDLIFYDPFSAKTDTGLWTADVFARIRRHSGDRPAELYTYSAATAVRVALLTAGFYVAAGVGTGPKAHTTAAFTHAASLATHPAAPRLLGADWLARWRRSDSKFPAHLPEAERPAFAQHIEQHPQFNANPTQS